MQNTTSRQDVEQTVTTALGDHAADFDVEAIADTLGVRFDNDWAAADAFAAEDEDFWTIAQESAR